MELSVTLHQIFYDDETRARLDPGFIPMDNSRSPRPNWFEIWPILEFFKQHTLDKDEWYGFYSPRFYEKTGFKSEKVKRAVQKFGGTHNVILFSVPIPRRYKNVFHQAEACHPGILHVAQGTLDSLNINVDLEHTVMPRSLAVFSNYFAATGEVWEKWLRLMRAFVEIADDPSHPLFASLNSQTVYREGITDAPFKIFVAERLASLLFYIDDDISPKPCRPRDYCAYVPRPLRSIIGCKRRR